MCDIHTRSGTQNHTNLIHTHTHTLLTVAWATIVADFSYGAHGLFSLFADMAMGRKFAGYHVPRVGCTPSGATEVRAAAPSLNTHHKRCAHNGPHTQAGEKLHGSSMFLVVLLPSRCS